MVSWFCRFGEVGLMGGRGSGRLWGSGLGGGVWWVVSIGLGSRWSVFFRNFSSVF